jgi:hypothetical protein
MNKLDNCVLVRYKCVVEKEQLPKIYYRYISLDVNSIGEDAYSIDIALGRP